jgi:hypothetical protein
MSTGLLREDFGTIYDTARQIIEARGKRERGGWRLTYVTGSLEIARTETDEYDVRHEGALVFRCRAGGVDDVFEPGEWMVRLVQVGRAQA